LTREEVEAYLKEHIPLSAAMAIKIVAAGPDGVSIEVPLGPNLNHRATAFGGSVAALAILAGWTLVHLRLKEEGLVTRTVVQSSSVDYDAPIHGTFTAVTEPVEPLKWEKFVRAITRHGKGRIGIAANVVAEGGAAARYTGAYVAIQGRKGAGEG